MGNTSPGQGQLFWRVASRDRLLERKNDDRDAFYHAENDGPAHHEMRKAITVMRFVMPKAMTRLIIRCGKRSP